MPALDFGVGHGCEYHHSLQLGYVCFIVIRELEKINQKVLESRMLFREFKLLSLEYQDRFDFTIDL